MAAAYLNASDRGKGFAKKAIALARAGGKLLEAIELSEVANGVLSPVTLELRAAVAAGTTTDSTWAGPFGSSSLSDDFLAFARLRSVVEQIAPAMRSVDPNTRVLREIGPAIAATWIGEGAPKPLASGAFDTVELVAHKLAAIAVLTDEMLRLSNAELVVRNIMAAALALAQDSAFLSDAAATTTNPGGVLAGITPIASTGDSSADISALFDSFEGNLETSYLVMAPATAAAVGLEHGLWNIGARGGEVAGTPVLTSRHVQADSSGSSIALLDSTQILFAAGNVEISNARHATLEMLDNPSNSSATATATTLVSLFQNDAVALRVERFISWLVARSEAVRWVAGVNYSST